MGAALRIEKLIKGEEIVKPKYLISSGLAILLFSTFTFNPSFLVINLVILSITLLAAFSLFTRIRQSSAYLTKCNLLASNSLSSSLSIILDNSGLRLPPCGVPFLVG